MVLEIECSNPRQNKPGIYRSNVTYFRVWWLWFAVALIKGNSAETHRYTWEEN